ncbi:divalent-cation tolerance protein CutA [Ponticaulis profundi]|uniref:Divalent-cation tolerance protein CutA n=1 Tax=Ponticaulis profundi TaxID=2665222 RepID=A0ABW1SA08_9PROT
MTDLILVRVNCGTAAEADRLGRAAVTQRLAACANIDAPVTAIYEWQDELHAEAEYVLWLKTRAELWSPLQEMLEAAHSYDTPAILKLEVSGSTPAFSTWVKEQTSVN